MTTVNKSQKLKYKNCWKIYSAKTGHNALKSHQKQHEKLPENSKILQFFDQEKSENDFDEKLIDFIVNGQHSFRIIEEQDFINLIKGLNPNVKIPSRKTLKTKVLAKSSKIKSKIIQILSETNSKISLTSDIWTSNCGEPYICVTAHFVNKKYELKNILIDFSNIPHPYGGVDIMEKLIYVLKISKLMIKFQL